jgi:NADH:ubiquinone oxidoreductase subunit F (NADH-binding)
VSLPVLSGSWSWPSVLLSRAQRLAPGAGIAAAEAEGAWSAWRTATADGSREGVIGLIGESGLRGRGGGGFPAGREWRAVAGQDDDRRHVVINGLEADPGVQLDRTLMELDPHAVVEGTAIAAWAVGAQEATIVVGAGATVAAERLRAAIAGAEERGHLDGSFSIEVRGLSGSFVIGEETTLLRALEGRRAQPDQRPPYPAERGLWGRPTLVHNVKTIAAVPWIVEHGAGAFAAIGSPEAPGTTLVQLGGAIRKPGIAEVPLGTPIREVLDGPGGFVKGKLKAVLVGGPTGGFLPHDALGTPVAYGELAAAGALMGSGSLLVIDASACLVELASLMTRYLSDEACGKTIPCRIGTRRLAELADGLCSGRCRPNDGGLIGDLSADVRDSALCALEGGAPNPLGSLMRYFPEEFEDHLVRGCCPAGVCRPITVRPSSVAGVAR